MTIQHALNGGEKIVAGYHVDGYCELPTEDSEPYTIGFEFMGCHVHQCPMGCQKSRQTREEVLDDYRRLAALADCLDELVIMRSCDWIERRRSLTFESKLSTFIGKTKIEERHIFRSINDDKFFGLVKLDISTPKAVIDKYSHLNFPFIFGQADITSEMLSSHVAAAAHDAGVKFPYKCMTLKWNAKSIILATPLLKFYLSIGMEASNIEWALEYNKAKPFKDFVQDLVDVRIRSYGNNAPLGDRFVYNI